ncbi:MAG: GGDEF domain-containing protein [Armatimonadota bacterium]
MQDSLIDKLTGLYNKKYFEKRLTNELERAKRYKRPLALLLFELDYNYFIKDYDVKWGVSYSILKQFGALILKIYRTVDLAGRYGGETFIAILPETPLEGARIAGERLRKAVEEHTFIGTANVPEIKVAINVGVVSYPECGSTIDELISAGHDAILGAKDSGGNKVVLSCMASQAPASKEAEGLS